MLVGRFKRLLISNELSASAGTKAEIDGNMIKKMTGRGDRIVARNHYCGEQEFLPHFMPVLFAQDCPKVSPLDEAVLNRVQVVHFNKTFVDAPPANAFGLPGDAKLKKELDTPRFRECFLMLVVKTFREYTERKAAGLELPVPTQVADAKKDWLSSEEETLLSKFLDSFEITNDPTTFATKASIAEWKQRFRIPDSKAKINNELKAHLAKNIETMGNCREGQLQEMGRVWYGIINKDAPMSTTPSNQTNST
jgi:phage/plasmid-associated DNA primase